MTDLQAWRDQVAAAVRGVSMTMLGGTCWFRATIGAMALAHLGMRPQRMMGGMIFRAGPDERLDTVPFCGPSNHAQWIGDRPLFHVWLEVDGDIIDFSCGDWKSQELLVEEVSAPGGEQPSRPIRWDVEPPDYIWQPADTLLGERFKAPPLGKNLVCARLLDAEGGKDRGGDPGRVQQRRRGGAALRQDALARREGGVAAPAAKAARQG